MITFGEYDLGSKISLRIILIVVCCGKTAICNSMLASSRSILRYDCIISADMMYSPLCIMYRMTYSIGTMQGRRQRQINLNDSLKKFFKLIIYYHKINYKNTIM